MVLDYLKQFKTMTAQLHLPNVHRIFPMHNETILNLNKEVNNKISIQSLVLRFLNGQFSEVLYGKE